MMGNMVAVQDVDGIDQHVNYYERMEMNLGHISIWDTSNGACSNNTLLSAKLEATLSNERHRTWQHGINGVVLSPRSSQLR